MPPTAEGHRIARKILDESWNQFARAMEKIREGHVGFQEKADMAMKEVAQLMEADVPVKVKVLLFVGNFENNAFTAPPREARGAPKVAIPVEGDDISIAMSYEFRRRGSKSWG